MIYRNLLILSVASLVFPACITATGYKRVDRHDTQVATADNGSRVLQTQSQGFISFEEIIERSPSVTASQQVTSLKDVREPGAFTLSPDGRQVVFTAYDDDTDSFNLWRVSSGGGAAATQITNGRYYDQDPAYSADGSSIYFASNRSSSIHGIWRVSATGAGGLVRITSGSSVDRLPTPGPGNEVLFASTPENASEPQVWSISEGGSLPTQLREGSYPQLSPDGTRILYSQFDKRSGFWRIWVMNVNGTNQTQLSQGADGDQMHATWAPDGEHIVFASNEGRDSNGKKNFDIWRMASDGSNPTQLSTNGSTDFLPKFSPTGKTVYFLSNRGFNWDIWRFEVVDM